MSTIRAVVDVQEELTVKRGKLNELMTESKNDAGEWALSVDQLDEVRNLNEELNDLGDELKKSMEIDELFKSNQEAIRAEEERKRTPSKSLPLSSGGKNRGHWEYGTPAEQAAHQMLSLGEAFTGSKVYKEKGEGRQTMNFAIKEFDPQSIGKKVITTTSGFPPENIRTGRVELTPTQPPMVDELLPQITTEESAVVYMEETTFTNAAAPTAEAGTYAESNLAYTERSEAIRKIATFLAVTDEQIDDEPQAQSLFNDRLAMMIRLNRENQLLQGTGVSPQFTGFYNKSGINTYALAGADNQADAIHKGMNLVMTVGFANPTGVIMHPTDWQTLRLMKTADGQYIWGNPSMEVAKMVWGVPVIATTNATLGTAMLGDFALYSQLVFKLGIQIKVSDSHSDFFIKGQQAIRAEERAALVIYRAKAFCSVSNL